MLHDHHFVATFHMTANGVPRSYRATTIPPWRDPLALVCAFAAIAIGVWIAGRPRRLGLALGVVGCAFAGAVYVHQQAVHTFVCPPGWGYCPRVALFGPPPDLWHDSMSLLIMASGIAVAAVLMLPRRWMAARTLLPRQG